MCRGEQRGLCRQPAWDFMPGAARRFCLGTACFTSSGAGGAAGSEWCGLETGDPASHVLELRARNLLRSGFHHKSPPPEDQSRGAGRSCHGMFPPVSGLVVQPVASRARLHSKILAWQSSKRLQESVPTNMAKGLPSV